MLGFQADGVQKSMTETEYALHERLSRLESWARGVGYPDSHPFLKPIDDKTDTLQEASSRDG